MSVSSFVSNLMDPLGLKKPQMSIAPKAPVSPLQPLAIPTAQKTATPAVPQISSMQANPNYTPANYSPSRTMSMGTSTPPATTTTSGKNINPATGGISNAPVPPTPPTPPAPVVPPTPTYTPPTPPIQSPYQSPTVPQSMYDTQGEAMKAYLASLNQTPEEEANAQQLENLQNSETLGLNKIRDQAIPMDFITGQSASLQRQALALQEPLAQKAARLQAKRLAAADASKFILDRADKAIETKQSSIEKATTPFGVSPGETQVRYDPTTGKMTPIYTAPEKESTNKAETEIVDINGRKTLIDSNTGEIIKELGPEEKVESSYRSELATTGRTAVTNLKTIAEAHPEIFGRTASLPISNAFRSDAFRNYQAQLDYLKGNIIPAALAAMREASKTGGALGNVSDKEGAYLASSLGALSMEQDPVQVVEQLKQIDESLARWQQAQSAGGSTGGDITWDNLV